MSNRLQALWAELFDREISGTEESLLKGVNRKVGSDSPLLILASLLVRTLYFILIESRDSPFRTLASVRRTMNEHRRSVEQITETYRILELNLSEWNGILARTEKDILELRKFTRAATLRQALSGSDEANNRPAAFAYRLLYVVWGGCFLCASAGALLVTVIFK